MSEAPLAVLSPVDRSEQAAIAESIVAQFTGLRRRCVRASLTPVDAHVVRDSRFAPAVTRCWYSLRKAARWIRENGREGVLWFAAHPSQRGCLRDVLSVLQGSGCHEDCLAVVVVPHPCDAASDVKALGELENVRLWFPVSSRAAGSKDLLKLLDGDPSPLSVTMPCVPLIPFPPLVGRRAGRAASHRRADPDDSPTYGPPLRIVISATVSGRAAEESVLAAVRSVSHFFAYHDKPKGPRFNVWVDWRSAMSGSAFRDFGRAVRTMAAMPNVVKVEFSRRAPLHVAAARQAQCDVHVELSDRTYGLASSQAVFGGAIAVVPSAVVGRLAMSPSSAQHVVYGRADERPMTVDLQNGILRGLTHAVHQAKSIAGGLLAKVPYQPPSIDPLGNARALARFIEDPSTVSLCDYGDHVRRGRDVEALLQRNPAIVRPNRKRSRR